MLEVVSMEEASARVLQRFGVLRTGTEEVLLEKAFRHCIANDVVALEGVPAFDRSTVDGFAVIASDTFGCSDALPALLTLSGEVKMGEAPDCACTPGTCIRIPTGGQIPDGADAVVMLEYCEEYGDGTIGVARAVAPGENIVFENDDVAPGQVLIPAETILAPHHIGTLASLGITHCTVHGRPRVAIISTGDEIIPAEQTPVASQMRDVNAPTLTAAVEACGAQAEPFPIVPDEYEALLATVRDALSCCDMVLVSGGSSAGQKDNTARVLNELGEMLFHGVAVKPGKPTMCADIDGTPAFGLPGHPVAAYFMFLELVRPLLIGANQVLQIEAVLTEALPSNHGRAELVAVRLEKRDSGLHAVPIHGKSGLISQLARADGYVAIARNQEGLSAGATIRVSLF